MAWGGKKYDAIVIGGGHNGLVAATLLAKASRRVLVLEASDRLGGAAVTSEITPDYRVSGVAHIVDGLPRSIEKDLKLAKHGLRYAARNMATVALDLDGKHVLLPRTRRELSDFAKLYPKDADVYRDVTARLESHAAMLVPALVSAPGGEAGMAAMLKRLIWRAEWRGADALHDFLRTLPESVGDFLDAEIELPLLKGALAFDATLGSADGPYAPGTMLRYIYRLALRAQGQGASLPLGGVGALTDALAASLGANRGEIRRGVKVVRIVVQNGAVAGVETDTGDMILAPLVLSSIGPRATMLDLLGAAHIETALAVQVSNIASRGATAKINLALDGPPEFVGLSPALHAARLLIAPTLDAVDRAATAFKRADFASEPVMEITVPSMVDASLAPPGHHVMSVLVSYIPYDVDGGWPLRREKFVQGVVRAISRYAPGLNDRLVAGEILTPPDIAEKYGLAGADWHQGDLRPDQMLGFRPVPALANYATPVQGLYLCGAGSHPGGGLTGLPGRLAAEAIVNERGRR